MEAIFYDRKNHREVKASELMSTNFVEVILVVDSEEFTTGEWQQDKHKAYLSEKQIATLGYKSKDCESYKNWDLYLNQSDLIFLRVE